MAEIVGFIINLFNFKKKICAVDKGPQTVFNVRNPDDSCSSTNIYDVYYFNPVNDPLSNSSIIIDGPDGAQQIIEEAGSSLIINDPKAPTFSIVNQSLYSTMLPMTATKSKTELHYNIYTTNSEPLNMCPENFISRPSTNLASQFSGAVPMPKDDPSIWIFSGNAEANQGKNGINVPVIINPIADGLASTLYILAVKKTSFYIELGGAYGGDVNVYTAGVDSTGQPRQTIAYLGGKPGVIFGNYFLKQNDILKVFLGSVGDQNTDVNGSQTFDGNGQGGTGTIFGGSNGGGPSYAVHYKSSDYSNSANITYDAAVANLGGSLVCVAGGGGGASRNSSGGAGGHSIDKKYGHSESNNVSDSFGSAGGRSFVAGAAPLVPGHTPNDLSGGGGSLIGGGISKITNQYPNSRSSFGSRLKPFNDFGHGGASVSTNISSGGGGGGGGFYGGGAGAWNNVSKPNNVHGGGGGGSSFMGLLEKTTTGPNVCLNAYKSNSNWTSRKSEKYGYMVLGLKENN